MKTFFLNIHFLILTTGSMVGYPLIAVSQTLEQEMQRLDQEKKIQNQRKEDKETAKRLAIKKDLAVGLKYKCGSDYYLFLRGTVYKSYDDYKFEKLERALEYSPTHDKGEYKQLENGTLIFWDIWGYHELLTSQNVLYTKYPARNKEEKDEISKKTCDFVGGDVNQFNK